MAKLEVRQLKTTADLCRWVRTELGHPVVKVELTDEQIINNILSSLNLFLRYASGQSTEDAYYTLMLKGGQAEYELNERYSRHYFIWW